MHFQTSGNETGFHPKNNGDASETLPDWRWFLGSDLVPLLGVKIFPFVLFSHGIFVPSVAKRQ